MGCDAKGRRHSSDAWLKCGAEEGMRGNVIGGLRRGKRLVVQIAETFREKLAPGFVDELEAVKLAENAGLPIEPVMIYSDDLTHIVTEEGIAYLHRCRSQDEREAAIKAVAGFTKLGMEADPLQTERLRASGIVKTPSDLGINFGDAKRSLLAAKNIRELVTWSKGLYRPPVRFRNW